jgi:peptide/nickel transport system substrate-binding protein
MNQQDIQGLIDRVKKGGLSRRGFIQRLAAVGLTAPVGVAVAGRGRRGDGAVAPVYKPTKRGGGGR